MKQIHLKLVSVILALMLSVSVVGASSYAWMVLSGNPAVAGIQVGIGGGSTVLIAPDITEEAKDGTVYHYPGRFSDKMHFGKQEAYAYLQEIGNLNPVSTVNGVDWILPIYYSGSDAEVRQGSVPSGTLKNISDFLVDSELTHANIPAGEKEKIEKGHYVYMDFWVVVPAGNYKLRVSTDVNGIDGGSFVIDLLEPQKGETEYTLCEPSGSAASAVRVGFLANDLILTDDTMTKYVASPYFDSRFHALKGLYQEPETGTAYINTNRFMIYEPNGDAHPAYPDLEGFYVETKPLGLEKGSIVEKSIHGEGKAALTVQGKSTWTIEADSTESAILQRFKTAQFSGTWKDFNEEEVAEHFYGAYLQGQMSPYVNKGGFVAKTSNLYTQLASGKVSLTATEGATDDAVIIELEKNIPQRIRMFIWLEGQDVDCIEQIATTGFAVNIELACGDE